MRDDNLPSCIFPAEGFSSSGVACHRAGRHCESCGWNPEVARERSREISRELWQTIRASDLQAATEQELKKARAELKDALEENRKLKIRLREMER